MTKFNGFLKVMLSSLIGLMLVSVANSAEENTTGASATAKATFAGGCFWCVEHAFDEVPGVISTTSGYIGGDKKKTSYEEVSAGGTGHAEAVEVAYDPQKISYAKLLDIFWHNIDPLDAKGQFCDKGDQYRSEIFYHDDEQKRLAEQSKTALEKSESLKSGIVTEIVAATEFHSAEEYHQDYHLKNPVRYKLYRYSCGRDQRLDEVWGKTARVGS